jgi:hypothetical protein
VCVLLCVCCVCVCENARVRRVRRLSSLVTRHSSTFFSLLVFRATFKSYTNRHQEDLSSAACCYYYVIITLNRSPRKICNCTTYFDSTQNGIGIPTPNPTGDPKAGSAYESILMMMRGAVKKLVESLLLRGLK